MIDEYLPARKLANGTYANPDHWGYSLNTISDIFSWQFNRQDDSKIPIDKSELDRILPVLQPNFEIPPDGLASITWLGHASILLQVGKFNILTDPVFSERCSPSTFFGPIRYRPCPIKSVTELPHVDAIVLSHNHYDHFDEKTISELADMFPKAQWYMPLENSQYLSSNVDKRNVHELNWWDSSEQDGFKFTCVPAQHWSKRGLFDTNKALWSGWVVEGKGGSFYFVGDTGYCPVFKAIGKRFKEFSISAIPIGAYEPRWFMKSQHIDREEAISIHQEVNSAKSLGIHWGTWKLTDEFYLEPKNLPKPGNGKEFFILHHGGSKLIPWILNNLQKP